MLHIVKTERGIFLQLFTSCLVVKLLQIYNSRLIGRNDGSNTTNPQTYISWRFACMFKKDSHAKLSQTYAQTILYHFKILNWQITCQLNICLLVFLFVTYLCRYSHRSLSFYRYNIFLAVKWLSTFTKFYTKYFICVLWNFRNLGLGSSNFL